LLESILTSNNKHIERAAEKILALGIRKLGILGFSFKSGTVDLRESPLVHLVKALIAEGCHINIWDGNVSLGRIIGSNRQFIEAYIPHIGTLLRDSVEEVIAHADVLVLGTTACTAREIISQLTDGQYFIDLSHLQQPVLIHKEITPVLVERS
jgi:GDP-mannose 6-dehydrogenase